MATEELTTKRCSTCKKYYLATSQHFSRNRCARDGWSNVCKLCCKEYKTKNREKLREQQKEYAQKNKEKIRESNRQWKIKRKKNNKTHIYKNEKAEMRYIYNRSYRIRNIEKYRQYVRNRRASKRKLECSISTIDWINVLRYWKNCCAICERPEGFWHTLAQDHWIPLSHFETPGHVLWNVLPLCHGINGCNNNKSKKLPKEWLVQRLGKRKASIKLKEIEAYFEHIKNTSKLA